MSDAFKPPSFKALRAASACSWICDRPGMTPRSVVSAAPTTATECCFKAYLASFAGRREEGQGNLVALFLEGHLEPHVEHQRIGRLRAADDIGHHARTLVQLDDGNSVGGREAGRRAVMDDITEEFRLAGGLDDRDLA